MFLQRRHQSPAPICPMPRSRFIPRSEDEVLPVLLRLLAMSFRCLVSIFCVVCLLIALQSNIGDSTTDTCVAKVYHFPSLSSRSKLTSSLDGAWNISVTTSTDPSINCGAITDLPPIYDGLEIPEDCDQVAQVGEGHPSELHAECRSLKRILTCDRDAEDHDACSCTTRPCEECRKAISEKVTVFMLTFQAAVKFNGFIALGRKEKRAKIFLMLPDGSIEHVENFHKNPFVFVKPSRRRFKAGDSCAILCTNSCGIAMLEMDVCSKPIRMNSVSSRTLSVSAAYPAKSEPRLDSSRASFREGSPFSPKLMTSVMALVLNPQLSKYTSAPVSDAEKILQPVIVSDYKRFAYLTEEPSPTKSIAQQMVSTEVPTIFSSPQSSPEVSFSADTFEITVAPAESTFPESSPGPSEVADLEPSLSVSETIAPTMNYPENYFTPESSQSSATAFEPLVATNVEPNLFAESIIKPTTDFESSVEPSTIVSSFYLIDSSIEPSQVMDPIIEPTTMVVTSTEPRMMQGLPESVSIEPWTASELDYFYSEEIGTSPDSAASGKMSSLPPFGFEYPAASAEYSVEPSVSPELMPFDESFPSERPNSFFSHRTSCSGYAANITFQHLSIGAAVTEGQGFELYTRRIGDGNFEDVSAVFDTSNPPSEDLDLGSPNEMCLGGGPGKGLGGSPGFEGENCIPLGHVLVAHSGNVSALRLFCSKCSSCEDCKPNDSYGGAEFVFTFTEDAILHDVVALDVDEAPRSISITKPSGERQDYSGLGENSKLIISLGDIQVQSGDVLKVFCAGSCALAKVSRSLCYDVGDFLPECSSVAQEAIVLNETPNPTEVLEVTTIPIPEISEIPSASSEAWVIVESTQEPAETAAPMLDTICRLFTEEFDGFPTGFPIFGNKYWSLLACRADADGTVCGVSAALNTSIPNDEDYYLGAPNNKCPGGGPGVGWGGEPGRNGENCAPLGQVLIAAGGDIEELRAECAMGDCKPRDHNGLVSFEFTFLVPVKLSSFTIMDLDDSEGSATLTFPDDHTLNIHGFGDNSITTVDLHLAVPTRNKIEARESITITCRSSCAIAQFVFHIC